MTFLPAEGGRPGSAVSDAQGRYTIKTYEDAAGAIVGSHKVSVVKISGAGAYAVQKDAPAESSEQTVSDGSDSLSEILVTDSDSTTEPEIVYDIPERYMDPNRSGLMIIVPAGGSNELDLELVD